MLVRVSAFALSFLAFAASSLANATELLPSIISIGGTGQATVISGERTRPIEVGLRIEYGSKIKTAPGNTVTLQYPDKTIISIDADSEVDIQERTAGTQTSRLHVGQIRASVLKAKSPEAATKPKFIVRTRAAVLGVRGTEFVMAVDQTGYTTQVHTLEGVVDVAADESRLLSGQSVQVETGKFIQATEQSLGAPQEFVREEFVSSLKPSVPGGPSAPVFTDLGGHTIPKVNLLKLADPRNNPEPPAFKKEEQQQQKPQEPEKPKPDENKPREDGRRAHLFSFQMAAFYTSGLMDPAFAYLRKPKPPTSNVGAIPVPSLNPFASQEYVHPGFADRIRAIALSWDPFIPIPLTAFLAARGHFGWIIARDGSLANGLLINEQQAFINATVFQKFYGELGMGRQTWQHSPISEGLFTTNVGLYLRSRPAGFEFDRLYLSRSLLLTKPRIEEFRAGFGFSF